MNAFRAWVTAHRPALQLRAPTLALLLGTRLDYHPLLLALFPVLGLFNQNRQYVHPASLLSSALVTMVGTLVFMLLLRVVLRRPHRGELITSIAVLLFFSYGHVFSALDAAWPGAVRNRHLSLLWLALFALATRWIRARSTNPEGFARFLSVAGAILVTISLIRAADFEVRRRLANQATRASLGFASLDGSSRDLPDIYYIILDAHTRSDVLRQVYDYDNSSFIDQLERLGFYVAECSQANYAGTSHSLTSSFNLDYLDQVLGEAELLPDLRFSALRQLLRMMGYQLVVFQSTGIDIYNFDLEADLLIPRREFPESFENLYFVPSLNAFQLQLVETTWLGAWLGLAAHYSPLLPDSLHIDIDAFAYHRYWEILDILNRIDLIPFLESPKFVYVHLMVPHEPFIFDPSGHYRLSDGLTQYRAGYRNNTEFIDRQMPEILGRIISRSESPPIIVLQGDHGRNGDPPEYVMPILNAYYLPEGGSERLYPAISPVNTFRLIADTYFGTNYGLLEDLSEYYGTPVQNSCVPGQP